MVFGWGPSKRNSLRIHSHLSKKPAGQNHAGLVIFFAQTHHRLPLGKR